jgi:hypothetical protein
MNCYAIYSESKYQGGSCISPPKTIFFGDELKITPDLSNIVYKNHKYSIRYLTTKTTTGTFNYGGILGPKKVPERRIIFELENNDLLIFVLISKNDSLNPSFDRIEFMNKEFRPFIQK